MRVRGVGYWELFIPHARVGDHYKFDIIEPNGQHLPLKSDPVAFATEVRPKYRFDCFRPGRIAAAAPGAGRHECSERADIDL